MHSISIGASSFFPRPKKVSFDHIPLTDQVNSNVRGREGKKETIIESVRGLLVNEMKKIKINNHRWKNSIETTHPIIKKFWCASCHSESIACLFNEAPETHSGVVCGLQVWARKEIDVNGGGLSSSSFTFFRECVSRVQDFVSVPLNSIQET